MVSIYFGFKGSWNNVPISSSPKIGFQRTEPTFLETVNNLRPATKYYFFVASENVIGNSESEVGAQHTVNDLFITTNWNFNCISLTVLHEETSSDN